MIILFAQKVGKNAEGLMNTFISKKDYKQYLSWEEIDNYIKKQGYSKDEYFAFMQDDVLSEKLIENDIFKEYIDTFKPQAISKQQQKEWFEKSTFYKSELKQQSKEYKERYNKYLSSEEYKGIR